MNHFLAAAPRAEAAHGALGCMASLDDLADLDPDTRAVMHGSSVTGHCSGALRGLADDDERRLLDSTAA